jgi:Chagasin family peptidase inhibitor I42
LAFAAGLAATLVVTSGTRLAQARAEPVLAGSADRQQIATKPGTPIAIALDVRGGTGYAWRAPDPMPDGIRLLDMAFESTEPGRPGATVRQVLTLLVDQPGRDLTLVYRRGWIPQTPSDRRITLTFIATD